ncbi:hypothetical protein BSKO_11266 [Bryopsis sp. KO-2023]|nr:hypothetical protein BSKO_11266 [Bryopsis sp. KO-2023]
MHVCYANRAAAYTQLGLFEEALRDAEVCKRLAESALTRDHRALSTFAKSFLRKGSALLGLKRHREASLVFQEGLKVDPFNLDIKQGLDQATNGMLKDLLEGKGRETLALPPALPVEQISYHPYSTPLHKIKVEGVLPSKLLTPQQAQRDHHIRDIYNYVTIQTDIRMPKRQISYLEDAYRHQKFAKAIRQAVANIESKDMECRVLNVGAGAGLYSLLALEAGAVHATAVERWLYLSLVCKEVLDANSTDKESYKVVYKRPTDLELKTDVPICCNLLICDILDEVEVWHFDLLNPPDSGNRKTIDFTFTRDGIFNGVMFWYELKLGEGITLSTGMTAVKEGLTSLRPAVQFTAGEMRIDKGLVLPLVCSHNTVRIRFDVEEAEYLHLVKQDASFPRMHYSILSDVSRADSYDQAIRNAVEKLKKRDGSVEALDLGAGSGLLSLMCARAGASVVGCEVHRTLADIARWSAARNKLSSKVSVVQGDIASLQRGREVCPYGVNLVVADIFDSGLLGGNFLGLLETARKRVLRPDAVVIPQSATVYCMGVEIKTRRVQGFDFSHINKYRWDDKHESVRLSELPHRSLTRPKKVFDYSFDGAGKARGKETMLKLDVVDDGELNAVAFWFDLNLGDDIKISSAPKYVGFEEVSDSVADCESNREGMESHCQSQGVNDTPSTSDRKEHHWGQIEWGGGASVENPHYQRVHYCQLLVQDFLVRCKSKRFPSVQEDMDIVQSHCGSLFLDPASLTDIGHELALLERLHSEGEPIAGVCLEGVTQAALQQH